MNIQHLNENMRKCVYLRINENKSFLGGFLHE